MALDIYTLGHSNYDFEEFLKRLDKYHIDTVVDIRGTPYSKYNIQYNKERLAYALKTRGYTYIYMGKEFAAQRQNRDLYNEEGYADFEKVIYDTDFLKGIERLKKGCEKGYRIVLLGAKQDPTECHRFALVGRALVKNGFCVHHLLHDYKIASQADLEPYLVEKYYSSSLQLSLDPLSGEARAEEDYLNESYKKANRAIGYRVEHLKSKK